MPSTYTPIATTTLSTATASITFSSIPATYTDLILVFNGGLDPSANELSLRFNGLSSNIYSYTRLQGNGSSATSNRFTNTNYMHIGSPGNSLVIGNSINHIMNYANTTTYKTLLSRSNFTNRELMATAGLFSSTSAITSLTLANSDSNQFLSSGSSLTLYGIKAA
jgi:hypothetical protein